MPLSAARRRPWAVLVLVVGLVAGALGYGVAQSERIKQAEWLVYLVQALGLDWNLPPNALSDDYLARLNWTSSVAFDAARGVEGTGILVDAERGIVRAERAPADAVYSIATLRPGEYGFRVRVAGGTVLVRIGDAVFEAYEPTGEPRWVDLDRVALDPGPHALNVVLSDGAILDEIEVTPPCIVPVEPPGGWRPLDGLTYGAMAVTIAQALELEHELPALGSPIELRGEDFTRIFQFPLEEDFEETNKRLFWLNTLGSLVVARTRFRVAEPGLYSIEARYLSPKPVRWIVDGCLRVVTCPVTGGSGVRWTRVAAFRLEAGEHEIEVTLPPHAGLDQVVVQRRDGATEEYLSLVEGEGFKMSSGETIVARRDAIAAARRLRSLFDRRRAMRCADTLLALEKTAAMRLAAAQRAEAESRLEPTPPSRLPILPAGGGDDGAGSDPLFPKGDPGGGPPVASPVEPGS